MEQKLDLTANSAGGKEAAGQLAEPRLAGVCSLPRPRLGCGGDLPPALGERGQGFSPPNSDSTMPTKELAGSGKVSPFHAMSSGKRRVPFN